MNNFEEQVQEIEISVEQAENTVRRGQAMKRLLENPDYKMIFEENYFELESIRLVSLLTHPEMKTPEKQQDLLDEMKAISNLQMFISMIMHKGEIAEAQLEGFRAELEALEEEQASGQTHADDY